MHWHEDQWPSNACSILTCPTNGCYMDSKQMLPQMCPAGSVDRTPVLTMPGWQFEDNDHKHGVAGKPMTRNFLTDSTSAAEVMA